METELLKEYQQVWQRVRVRYMSGTIVYERGLQAALYAELYESFPKWDIVVEPHWETQIPDLIIVESKRITDIFELKFVPHNSPQFQGDTQKLLEYSGEHPSTLNPKTGHWEEPLPISKDCRLHFVVVGRHNSKALYPENIRKGVNLWFGRVCECENDGPFLWDITEGKGKK